MTAQQTVGLYLGREVRIAPLIDLTGSCRPRALSDTALLCWLSTQRELEAYRFHLRDLVAASPLVLAVGGPHAEAAFDSLLHYTGAQERPDAHIMTAAFVGDLDECVEEFLYGSWPEAEFFDSWTGYLLVASEAELRSLRRSLELLLRRHRLG